MSDLTGRRLPALFAALLCLALLAAGCQEKDYTYHPASSDAQAGRYLNGFDQEKDELVDPEITVWADPERTNEMDTYPDGTEVKILGYTTQTPQMMKVRLPDGRTGWIPADGVRKKPRP